MRLLFISLFCLFSSLAQAEMFFEPTVGYGNGSYTAGSGSTSLDYSTFVGPSVGAKFGVFYDYLYLVADIQYSLVNAKTLTVGSSIPIYQAGFGIGIDLNIPIRLFYSMDTNSRVMAAGGSIAASGSRMSIGYYLDFNIIVGLQLSSVSGDGDDASFNMKMITFSFPLEFIYPQTSWKEKTRK